MKMTKERVWTYNQEQLEEYINDDEDSGRLLNALGIITDEELAAGIHKDEEFRVRIEQDPALADRKMEELEETGQISELAKEG
jgi:hypothetical protein